MKLLGTRDRFVVRYFANDRLVQVKLFGSVATLLLITMLVSSCFGQGRTTTIAATGDTFWGSGTDTLRFFSTPILNNDGHLAFVARLDTRGNSATDTGIYRSGFGGFITEIVREGDAIVGNEVIEHIHNQNLWAFNDASQLAFSGAWNSGADVGLFRTSAGNISRLVATGDAAPDNNGTMTPYSTYMNQNGVLGFIDHLAGTSGGNSDNTGLFRIDGNLTQVAREGGSSPDGGTYISIDTFAFNDSGQFSFNAGTSANRGIFRSSANGITPIVYEGDTAPDGDGIFDSIYIGTYLNNAGQIAFQSDMAGTNNSSGIFRSDGTTITQIARTNDVVPDGDGRFASLSGIRMNQTGEVAFRAYVQNTASGNDYRAFFRTNAAGSTTHEIVRAGQLTPDGDGTFRYLDSAITLNDEGHILFKDEVDSSTQGDLGLFIADEVELVQVARYGDAVNGSTLTEVSYANGSSSSGTNSALNNHGQVAYQATLADGTQAAQLWTPDLHWRHSYGGNWNSETHWTLGINPAQMHDVYIDSNASLTVNGPNGDVTVRSLQIGGGTGIATLRLRNGVVLGSQIGTTIQTTGVLTGDGTVAGDITNYGKIELDNVNVNSTVTNYGFVEGDGRLTVNGTLSNSGIVRGNAHVTSTLINQADGEIRVAAGEQMRLGGSSTANNLGLVENIGGELEVDPMLINRNGSGLITARNGTMRFNQGLQNAGGLAFSFGTSDVHGDIDNFSTGVINLSGGANVTFYDDLTQNGTMVVAKVGDSVSTATMFGDFTGAGGFVGGGHVFFFGDMRLGNSPASVLMDGNTYLGPLTESIFELGGLDAGQFDQMIVTGDLGIDGDLTVSLIDNFSLTGNDEFLIADVGGILQGEFSGLGEGDLVGNYGGVDLFISYAGGDGNDVTLFTAVPEPNGLAMLLPLLAIGFARFRSRCSRRSAIQ